MMEMERMKDASYLDPELAKILQESGPLQKRPLPTDIPALRKKIQEHDLATRAANKYSGPVKETDHEIETRDGAKIIVRVYQGPTNDGGPALVWLYGGGFCLGSLTDEEELCRQFCEMYGGIAFNVEYRLAPEHPFPVGVYDGYDALKWVAANAEKLGADLSKGFILGGVSAGANIAAVASHLYRDEKVQPPLTGIFLSIPTIIDHEAVPEKYKKEHTSLEDNRNGLMLNEEARNIMRGYYAADPFSPLRSPLLFETGHSGLPPTYFQVCGLDHLRDDGLIYERVLREDCGVQTKLDLYPGLPHGFWDWWPKADFSAKQHRDSIDGLGWLLEVGKEQT